MKNRIHIMTFILALAIVSGCTTDEVDEKPSARPQKRTRGDSKATVSTEDAASSNTSKIVTPVGVSSPSETSEGSRHDREGFATMVEDGRLWVFRAGSKDLADFQKNGELAKHVIRIGAGPGGMTVKAPDTETLDAYLAAKPGFHVQIEDGRLWVFRAGSKELADFQKNGELAKHVIRIGAGPGGVTVKAPDTETLDAYLAAGS